VISLCLQILASLRHSSIVLTSYLFSLLLIERGLRYSSTLLRKKSPPLLLHIVSLSLLPWLFFFFNYYFSWPLCRKTAPASPHGKGHRCRQEARLLWEEEGPDINRKRRAAGLLLPPSEGAWKTMSARGLGLAGRKRVHAGVRSAEEMISATWPDLEQR